MTKTEKSYLQIINHYGGVIDTRRLRDEMSKYRTSRAGMSALGGICKVLRRLERNGFLSATTRDEYKITDAGRSALQ